MIKLFFLTLWLVISLDVKAEKALSLKEIIDKTFSNNPLLSTLVLNLQENEINTQLTNEPLSSILIFNARAQLIEPSSLATNRQTDDHLLSLVYSKKLYDFGLSESKNKETSLDLESITLNNSFKKKQLRLEVITDYFNVLLSDLEFDTQNEAMSVAFITMDRIREKMELKEKTEIDYLESQNNYQIFFLKRAKAEQLQRLTRSKLAQTMGGLALVSNIKNINKYNWDKKIPDYDNLLVKVLKQNESLLLLLKQSQLVKQKIETNQQQFAPSLSLEADINEYSKKTPSTHSASVRLLFNYPLYNGDNETLQQQKLQIKINTLENELQTKKNLLKHETLQLWQELNHLKLRKNSVLISSEYRDFYLDKSRALYELELKSDLGDAMSKYSAVILEQAQVNYLWLLAWEKLALLANDKKLSILRETYE